ncbi:hypothetical protein [Sodalis sp.]|uniref:hypothetical protein n=1 Tax=Sodalis sp. (in: enterobacteria) TaxID=1898979 RepID=UPI0038737BB3
MKLTTGFAVATAENGQETLRQLLCIKSTRSSRSSYRAIDEALAFDEALALTQPASDKRWLEAIVTGSPLMMRSLEQVKDDRQIGRQHPPDAAREVVAKAFHSASCMHMPRSW